MNPPVTRVTQCKEFWRAWWPDALACASLAGLAATLLMQSWRKWPDPVIDFGREVYLPWRISLGAVFGRDVDSLYGPLSAHVNAAVFAIAGPGIMHLVVFNLAIYAVIVAAAYLLLRRGWGRAGAWAGASLFASVFSFLQLTGRGNYNYATPYSHEATHGVLVLLLLGLVLAAWRRRGSLLTAGAAGLLLGFTAVLKIEILVTGLGLTVLAALLHWRAGRLPGWRAGAVWAGMAVLPAALFAAHFVRHMPATQAVATALQAVTNVLRTSRFVAEKVQLQFSGLDDPGKHAWAHLLATLVVLAFVAALIAVGRLVQRERDNVDGWRLLAWGGAVLAAGVSGLFGWWAPEPGFALLGLAMAVVVKSLWDWEKARRAGAALAASEARVLFAAAGVLMMLRMPLAGRIYHYGFYQAAMAAMAVAAALVTDVPRLAGGCFARRTVVAGALALLAGLALHCVALSNEVLAQRTLAIGEGADRMLHYSPKAEPAAELVRQSVEFLRKSSAPDDQVLVLPEGVFINYLTRRATPLATTHFFAGALVDGREAQLVKLLRQAPPEWVVVVSRNLQEYGVERYGEKPGHGELLLRWVLADYQLAAEQGGDPLDPAQRGVRVFKYPGKKVSR